MKIMRSTLGAFALAICISSGFASEWEPLNPIKPATSLLNLPIELLLNIFKNLDLSDTISVAKTHPHIRDVVDYHVIRRLIANRTLEIVGNCVIKGTDKKAEFQTVLDLFQYFGHYITKLDVVFDRFPHIRYLEVLNKYINRYGAASLKEIHLHANYLTLFNPIIGLIGPFHKVEYVRLASGEVRSRTNFSKIFPSLRSLDVGGINLIGAEWNLMQPFSNLERLTIPYSWGALESNFAFLRKTLELNPQLKHVTIAHGELKLFQEIHAIRPNLESLEIFNLNFAGNEKVTKPIRFENMKSFTCRSTIPFAAHIQIHVRHIPLEFGNLEEIQFNREDLIDFWIKIVKNNRNLKKIVAFCVLSDQQLERIVDGLEKLEEFSMNFHKVIPARAVQFIEKAKQLKNISLFNVNPDTCQEIAEQIVDEWKNVLNTPSICSFVRL